MQPDALICLAHLIEENRLAPEERRVWAERLRAWAATIERARNERLTR